MNHRERPDQVPDSTRTDASRYAVYYAPAADSDWWQFGNTWLGRDPITGDLLHQPEVPGVAPERLAELTAEARRYGLHATLKPPFRLAAATRLASLSASIARLAASRSPFPLGRVEVAMLGGFIALQVQDEPQELLEVANDCVEQLDAFRAVASAAELARRRSAGLTGSQDELLQRWGYPFVFAEWQFHMTLTSRLGRAEAAGLLAWLRPHVERLNGAPLMVDSLCLFEEAVPGAPFRLIRRYGFDGSVTDYPGCVTAQDGPRKR